MKILFGFLGLVALVVVLDGVRLFFLIRKSTTLVESAVPFSRPSQDGTQRILVMGDSTAVGTGATRSEDSTAGRLAQMYPKAEVMNLAENGMQTGGLVEVLEEVADTERFDLILIQIGANDIIRMKSLRTIERNIDTILSKAQKLSQNVVVLHSGDVGEAPFFPFYVRPLLTYRSDVVRDIYIATANKYGATYVDLMNSSSAKLIPTDVARYHAPDLLHLSGEGYGLWFEEIQKHLPSL